MRFEEAENWRKGAKKASFYSDAIREKLGDRERERGRMKIVKPADMPWEDSPQGRLKHVCNAEMPVRVNSVDAYLQEIPPGSRSGRHRHMADEILYVLEGHGYDLHWDVELALEDEYEWKVAAEPSRWDWEEGDLVWIPPNTVHQHFNADPSHPARFISAQNRMFKHMGYDDVEQLEPAPEWRGTGST